MSKSIGVDDLVMLRRFVPSAQMDHTLREFMGEERAYFREKMAELAALVRAMPCVGAGADAENPTVWLHYFGPGIDAWIVEREGDAGHAGPQFMAFGWVRIAGCEPEAGYISLPELFGVGVELDFFWTPVGIRSVLRDK